LKSYKNPGTDQIRAELIKERGEKSHSELHTLIFSVCNKEKFGQQWTVNELFIDFKQVKREVLYNSVLEFYISKKLVSLITIFLNETYSKVCVVKYLSDTFLTQNA
jgi:hypothetical protein